MSFLLPSDFPLTSRLPRIASFLPASFPLAYSDENYKGSFMARTVLSEKSIRAKSLELLQSTVDGLEEQQLQELARRADEVRLSQLFSAIPSDYRLDRLPSLGTRARNVLKDNNAVLFRDIHDWTIRAMLGMWNVGATTVDEVLGALARVNRIGESSAVGHPVAGEALPLGVPSILPLQRSGPGTLGGSPSTGRTIDLRGSGPATARDSVTAWWEVTRALRIISGWSAANRDGAMPLGEVLAELTTVAGVPLLVRQSLELVNSVAVRDLAPEARPNSAEAEIRQWIQTLDNREYLVLTQRLLAAEPVTLASLGAVLSMSRERVRQIERQVQSKALLLFTPEWRPMAQLLSELKGAVGALAPVEMVPAPTFDLSDLLPSIDVSPLEMVLRLAGDGQIADGFIGFPDLTSLRARSANAIADVLTQGPAERAVLLNALQRVGVPEYVAGQWLATFDLAQSAGKIAEVPRTISDKVALVLATTRKPYTLDQLVVALEDQHGISAIRNALNGDDRFVKVGIKKWTLRELADDAGPTFSGLRDAMTYELTQAGGSMTLKELTAVMVQRHGAARGSVRVYSNQAPFQRVDGVVSIAS
mgnify:FL=1